MQTVRKTMLVLLSIFLFFSLTKTIFDYRNTVTFYQGFKNEYEKVHHDHIALQTQILRESDENEIEKTIRNKLNLLKPNEIAIIVPFPSPTPTRLSPTPAPPYKQWQGVLLGD
ncbi:septum formation initiator family protein [Candidatus Microgenomates bacterium]|nr:septum formation initiator family protein [Candidatus Microgenomates bacterium]